MKKKAYQAVGVKSVQIAEVVQRLADGPLFVGLDIAKAEVLVVVRDQTGKFERPWKVRQPTEVPELVQRLKELGQGRELTVALESTGTYGDALRQSLQDAGLRVQRVSAKATSDYSEIFDNVPSQHDGKDAAIIAELASTKRSVDWPCTPPTAWEGELADQVQWLDTQQDILQLWLGRLEAFQARHWPELAGLLALNSATQLQIWRHYGGPEALAQDPAGVERLNAWGGWFLSEEKITAILNSARTTIGVRMTAEQRQMLQRIAQAAQSARQEVQQSRSALEKLSKQEETLRRMSTVIGAATACVLYLTVGNPHDYSSAAAYRKALGLNLAERSSGQYKGALKISKRGPSLARRWLYFAALRMVQQQGVREWFEAKKERDNAKGQKAVVGVMRKLALAVHVVTTQNEAFDPARLFPGRPLVRPAAVSTPATSTPATSTPAVSTGPTDQGGSLPGALPPDPRDLAHRGQARTAAPQGQTTPETSADKPQRKSTRKSQRQT